MEKVENLKLIKCCVNCTNWDEGHGEWKSICVIDSEHKVFSAAHVCDAWKVVDNYYKNLDIFE